MLHAAHQLPQPVCSGCRSICSGHAHQQSSACKGGLRVLRQEGGRGSGTHLTAATVAAPLEMPQSRPSSSARRRAMQTLSRLDTWMTSSSSSTSSTPGMNPAPMPWICANHQEARRYSQTKAFPPPCSMPSPSAWARHRTSNGRQKRGAAAPSAALRKQGASCTLAHPVPPACAGMGKPDGDSLAAMMSVKERGRGNSRMPGGSQGGRLTARRSPRAPPRPAARPAAARAGSAPCP